MTRMLQEQGSKWSLLALLFSCSASGRRFSLDVAAPVIRFGLCMQTRHRCSNHATLIVGVSRRHSTVWYQKRKNVIIDREAGSEEVLTASWAWQSWTLVALRPLTCSTGATDGVRQTNAELPAGLLSLVELIGVEDERMHTTFSP